MDAAVPPSEHSALLPKPDDAEATVDDTRTLLIACALTTFFFVVELVGGYIAGSLAIISDAAHLLSDLAGFAISLVAVSVSRLPANAYLSFGFARAEVLGAFVSILFIWALTAVLLLFAVRRLFNPSPVNGPLMLLLGLIGLAVNLCLGLVLGHGHSHGHDHAHSHTHGDIENHPGCTPRDDQSSREHNHDDSHPHDNDRNHRHGHGHDHDHGHDLEHDHEHGHGRGHGHEEPSPLSWNGLKALILGDDSRSVNVRAAYLHVLGDALQNVGVVIAALIITFYPHLSFIDPLCTLIFAVIVILTTAGLAKETMGILMEGTPPGVKLADVHERLSNLSGVSRVGDLHVWSITPRSHALSVHLYKTAAGASHEVLKAAQSMLAQKFGIFHATIQVNCETSECCDEEKYLGPSASKNCVTSDSLQAPNGAV